MHQKLLIHIDHVLRCSLCQLHALVQQNHTVTVFCNAGQIMADEQNGLTKLFELFKFMITLCLEEHVSHRQSLIYNKDLRVNVDGHGKSQPHKHAAGIGLHRLMDKFSDICKIQYILQTFIDLLLGKSQHGTV